MNRRFTKVAPALCLLLVFFWLSVPSLAQEKDKWPDKTDFTTLKEVWRTPAKSQGRTGTCWCFSTNSFLESEVYRLTGKQFDLSEIYTVFHAYLEKAERYVRLHGATQFGQGGLSHDVLYLAGKYGLVRKSDYSGLLPGETIHNHGDMASGIKAIVDKIIEARPGQLNWKWYQGLEGWMAAYIGMPPGEITCEGKVMTPKQFADEVLQVPYDDYIEITSYSYMPFNQTGDMLIPDNWLRRDLYNVELEDLIKTIDHALENGFSLVFDLDVRYIAGDKGYAVWPDLNEETVVDQAKRDELFDTYDTQDHHLEHVVGIGQDSTGKKFYLVKDSGGESRGPFRGHEYFSENFVRAKVLFIMLHKDGIPADVKQKLGIE